MGRSHLTEEQQQELGREVARARRAGVMWKVLVRVYGRSKPQLWRYSERYCPNETHLTPNETH